MITIVGREIGIEEEPPLLMVGVAESATERGRAFYFQCDLRRNEYVDPSNWPEGESYCVVNEGGRTVYGCVRRASYQNGELFVEFSEKAVRDLNLEDSQYTFVMQDTDADLDEVRRQLVRILTCGRPDYHPAVLEL
jgi:hypothetical protein